MIGPGHEVLGNARHPTPTDGGPKAVAEEMAKAMREACEQAGTDGRGPARRRRRLARHRRRTGRRLERAQPARLGGQLPARRDTERRARHAGEGRQRRAGGDRRRVPPRRRPRVPLAARGVLGHRRRRRDRARRHARGSAAGGAGEIGHMVVVNGGHRCPVRAARVHGGLRRARRDGGSRAQGARGRREDRPVQDDGGARPHPADERHLGARAEERGQARRQADRRGGRARSAPASRRRSTCSTSRRVIGGGLGVRFGEPFAQKIAKAMQPHLFNDRQPPEVRLAALGDLGGAIGASLLASGPPAGV